MKQKFSSCLFFGMALLSTVTLTSCGGDDDGDPNPGAVNTNGGNASASDYFLIIPPVDFGTSFNDTKEKMNSWNGWHLDETSSNAYQLLYEDNEEKHAIIYGFYPLGTKPVTSISVAYMFDKNITLPSEKLISDLEKYYNCSFKENTTATDDSKGRKWHTTITLPNKNVCVISVEEDKKFKKESNFLYCYYSTINPD